MKSTSSLALERQRQFFDRMIEGSKGALTFDLDVTAEVRPGYFGLPDVGTVFVENRYAADGYFNKRVRQYWPHRTLRALWSLAEVVDPVRLRMEVLNPLRRAENYPDDDPLAPKRYRADTLFAIAMVSSPLGWFETSGISPETRAEMRPLVATWKRERTNIRDVSSSTPSLVYDRDTGLVYNYYYERGRCVLKRRVAMVDEIFDRPLAWPEAEVVAFADEDRSYDAGNVNVTTLGDRHCAATYTGSETDTSVVVVIAEAPGRDR